MYPKFLLLAPILALIVGCAPTTEDQTIRLAALEKAQPQTAQTLETLRADVDKLTAQATANAQKMDALQQSLARVTVGGKPGFDDTASGESLRRKLDTLAATIDDMRRKLDRICFYQQPGAGDFLAPCKK